jgi:tetratricopeptide (TPR) repeat protein
VLGEKHPKTAKAYNSLGAIYLQKKDYDNAIFNFEKALAIKYKLLGEKHPETATSYNNIGIVYSRKGDYDNAIKYYQKSLNIKIDIFGETHREIAVLYNNIGSLYNLTGDYEQAIHYFDKALSINLKALGETHPDSADSYFNLGKTYYQNGNYEKALKMLNRSLAGKMRAADKNGNTYNYLSLVCIALGKWKQALNYAHDSFQCEERHQNGLNYLCMALFLKDTNIEKDEEFLDLLNRITSLTKLDQMPDVYFRKAIEIATKKTTFLETLIPTLSEYGKYLYQNGKIEEGIQKLRLAKEKAEETVKVYQTAIQRTCDELDVDLETL